MNTLKKAFGLLDGFSEKPREAQEASIAKVEELLRAAHVKAHDARLALRELDQLRKQYAYMLITAGEFDKGIKEMTSLVDHYESTISSLHDEAAFQAAEAAVASYEEGLESTGEACARSALRHAGKAQSVSRKVLTALEALQRNQEAAG